MSGARSNPPLTRGMAVRCLRGRDSGRLLAVLATNPEEIWVADGRRRPIERLKRKNPRHVAFTGVVLDESSMATNRELRRALARAAEAQEARRPLPATGE